jgi:DNA-binding NarL/FixJ family response regulator
MAEPAGPGATQDITVLICDDSPGMRTLLSVVINEREGLSVAGQAADGDEAIAQAETLQPDVVLLDLSMPKRTGLEALPEIKRVAPDTHVVVLSGFAASIVEADVVGNGVSEYLQKGAEPDEILAAIQRAAAP